MENETTMTNEQSPQSGLINTNRIIAPAGLGKRLRASRESLRLSEKEAAARLRLNPRIIPIMENEDFDNDLPPTFMRGYLRSYMRMLNLPEEEINITVTRIEATLPQQPQPATPAPSILTARPRYQSYRYLRWMTYVVAGVLAVLVSMWWTSHSKDTVVKAPDPSTPTNVPAEAQAPVTPAPTPDQPAASTTAPVIPALPMVEKPTSPAANSTATDDSDDDTQTTDSNNTTDQKHQISAALDAASSETNPAAPADNTAASATSETDATTTESTPKRHARSEASNQDNVYNDY